MRHPAVTRFGIWALFFVLACQGGEKSAPTQAPAAAAQGASPAKEPKPAPAPSKSDASTGLPDSLPNGLLLSYSQFEVVDGKATAKPGPARLDILTREGGEWKTETLEDAQSNVFHKAMMLTPRGQALVDGFDENRNPMVSCGNPGPPKSMIVPYPVMITRPDEHTVVFERELMEELRVVHLDRNHPPGEPSVLGHSVGWFEGNALVVETTNFIADTWGTHTGIDSSEQKHLVERFTLSDDGLYLHAEITVTDPVYLAVPVTFTHRWTKLADREVIQAPCTMEAARLYLEAGYEERRE